jgi:hypothetical protein
MTRKDLLLKLSAYSDFRLSLGEVLGWVADADWIEAKIYNPGGDQGGEIDKDFRNASSIALGDHKDKILSAVNGFVDEYCKRNNLENLIPESFGIVRYSPGQFFNEHSDGSETLQRKLSMVVYLNDNYLGGEISFTKFNSSFKPTANTVFLFPPTEEYSHAAKPVVEGTKYVLVGFWK